jgi:hypothetical protein
VPESAGGDPKSKMGRPMIHKRFTAGLLVATTALAVPATSLATTPPSSAPPSSAPSSEPAGSAPTAEPVDLSEVCPDPIVIQTDWFPESEHGAVYNLLGDDYEVDVDNKIVSGSLVSEGQPTGIGVEIRAGGAAGAGDVETLMYTDDDITFAFGTTDGQILSWENTPLMTVVAPLDISPLMIMWDPATYPDVTSIADLGEQGITINAFGGQTFTPVLAAMGVISEDQVDPSYDGGPTRFITENGAIAQQGLASAEPYLYEHVYEDWMRPVAYQLIHDAGFETYSQTLAIRPDDLETLRPCLEAFVPIVQRSVVDFVTDPTRTNATIVDVVEHYDTFWVYTPELADYSVQTQADLGLTGNGPDGTIGNLEPERVETLLQQVRDAGLEVPDDLTATQLYTNEFIDEAIGL